MARYTEAACRQCRREGCKLFLKGARCTSKKCEIDKRNYLPGQHGKGRKKTTEYGVQLREKQKAKRAYGLLEKQFRHYYERADLMKGVTGETMLSLIERRLDNVVYRMGIGDSRAHARQIVSHGHITVNGRNVNIPSYEVKAGDTVAIKENKKEKFASLKDVKPITPKWVEFDTEKLSGRVLALPQREDVDLSIAEHMIVEYYSK
ncbi:MAG: 30S ribosomal protein S4 [Firmicutes bacterium]|nr:30S ribosomal protein S4 [Bacillota bacterium]